MFGLSTYHILASSLIRMMSTLQPIPIMNVCHKGTDWEQEYRIISENVAAYSLEHEPLFQGDLSDDGVIDEEDVLYGKIYTAALMIAIARNETGFINKLRGDYGNSVCLMQINKYNAFRIDSGWSAEEIEADYQKCFELGYQTLQHSFKAGGSLAHRLKIYVSGRVDRGTWAAFERCKTFTTMLDLPLAKWCY